MEAKGLELAISQHTYNFLISDLSLLPILLAYPKIEAVVEQGQKT